MSFNHLFSNIDLIIYFENQLCLNLKSGLFNELTRWEDICTSVDAMNLIKVVACIWGLGEFCSTLVDSCVFDSHILCYNTFYLLFLLLLLRQLILESSFTFYSSRFYKFTFISTQVILKRLTFTSVQVQNKSSSVTPDWLGL